MNKVLLSLILFFSSPLFAGNLIQSAYDRLHAVWTEGALDLYFSGYAWHNRYFYDPERIKRYNEAAWGGGLGKGLFDEDGDWHGLFAIAFLESHRRLEPTAGYCFLKVANLNTNLKAGLGYTILVTSRPDILNGIPFPGILPSAAIFYKKAAISASYVPGSSNVGNVLFVIGKFTF